jgi:hypothetical protein
MKEIFFVFLLIFLTGCSLRTVQQSESYDPFTNIAYKHLALGLSTRGTDVSFATLHLKKSNKDEIWGSVELKYIRSLFGSLFAGKNHGIKKGDNITFTVENAGQPPIILNFIVTNQDYDSFTESNGAIIQIYKGDFGLKLDDLKKIVMAQKLHFSIPTGYEPIKDEFSVEQRESLLEFIGKK